MLLSLLILSCRAALWSIKAALPVAVSETDEIPSTDLSPGKQAHSVPIRHRQHQLSAAELQRQVNSTRSILSTSLPGSELLTLLFFSFGHFSRARSCVFSSLACLPNCAQISRHPGSIMKA